jgi:hypothetical protein
MVSHAERSGREEVPRSAQLSTAASANGHRSDLFDQIRNATHPTTNAPTPNPITLKSVVANRKIHPANAISAGTGYNHMRYGRSIAGAVLRSTISPTI